MPTPTIIHCDEITPDPIIVTLGPITIDVTKITAYHTIRMLKLIEDIKTHTATPTDATRLILDIIHEQNPTITDDDLLKSGTQHQITTLINTITTYVLKTYTPLKEVIDPFLHPPTAHPPETPK